MIGLPMKSGDIQHHPYTLRKLREGSYETYRGERRIGALRQVEAWRDHLAGHWRFWPIKGHPGGYHESFQEALETIREFDDAAQ